MKRTLIIILTAGMSLLLTETMAQPGRQHRAGNCPRAAMQDNDDAETPAATDFQYGPGYCTGMGPGHGFGPGNGMGPGIGMGTGTCQMLDMIPDLTEEQEKEISSLQTAHMKTMLQLQNQMNEKEAALQTLSTADKADISAINAAIDGIAALQALIMKEQATFRQAIRAILTEEQRVIFDAASQHRHHQGGPF